MNEGRRIGICANCSGLMLLTRHHIIPRSKGGSNDRTNLVLVCRPCHDDLDHKAGVRPKARTSAQKAERKLVRHYISTGRCECGNSIPGRLKGQGNCQRCQWRKDRESWHESRRRFQEGRTNR